MPPLITALVCLVIFIDSAGYGVVVPVIPLYTRQLGIGEFKISLLFATYAIALLIAAIPMGMLSDRLGRRPFVLFGMFAMSGAFVFYAMAESYWVLVTARVLDGLTAAATWSAGLALVGDRFEGGEIGQKLGYTLAAMATGTIAGPLIGGVLSDSFGYRAPFFFIAGVCFAGGLAALFLKRERGERIKGTATFKEMLSPVINNRIIRLACAVMLVTTMGQGLLEPLLPLHLQDTFSLSRTGIGVLFGVSMTTLGITSPLAGRLSDRVGKKAPIVLGMLATAALYPLLAVVHSLALMYVLMGLLGITFAMFSAPSMPLFTESLTTDRNGSSSLYGTAFGLMNLFWSTGYVLGPLVGGAVKGSWNLLAALCLFSLLVALLAVVVLKVLK